MQGWRYNDLGEQIGNLGPPLWDTIIKLSTNDIAEASKQAIPILIERVILAVELKCLTVAPSSFYHRLACRAAANVLGPRRKEFVYQCRKGIECHHHKKRNIRVKPDARPVFLVDLEKIPEFDPSEEELSQLQAEILSLDDDYADNSGAIHFPDGEDVKEHPCCHVALAIMRTGAIPLNQDTDDGYDAKKLAKDLCGVGERAQEPSAKNQTTQQADGLLTCDEELKGEDSTFEEHYTCVLRQLWAEIVHRDLSFSALLTLKRAVMVYRSRSTQTLKLSTPFLSGAGSPTLTQALLAQIIAVYLEALARDVPSGKTEILNEGRGITGDEESDGEKDGQEEDDTEGRCSPGPSMGAKRKGKELHRKSSKKAHTDAARGHVELH